MDVRDRIQQFVEQVPAAPAGDPEAVFRRGRRRAVGRRTVGAGAAVLLVAVAIVVFPTGTGQRLPVIGDAPEGAVRVPDGWQTVTAGEIAVSVPPDWHVSRPYADVDFPADATVGGPCLRDLYAPPEDSAGERPVAVVYDRPTSGACRGPAFTGQPERPGLVLFETVRGTPSGVEVRPGVEWSGADELAETTRIGALDVWRFPDPRAAPGGPTPAAPAAVEAYVADGLYGGLWVSHPDDPVVQQILETARPYYGEGAHTEVVELGEDEFEVLAAAATDDPSLKGTVVPDSEGLASVWRMGMVSGTPPAVPDGHISVLVFARQAQSTCRSVDDVLGVEIRDGLAVVVLDPGGEFLRACPGPDGAAAWTAFAIAIPDRYLDAVTGADSRLADPSGAVRGGCQPVTSASVRGMTGTFSSAAEAARSVKELPAQGSLVELKGDGQHIVFGWVVADELRYVIDTVRVEDVWTVGSYERCQAGLEPPPDRGAWVDDDTKEAWDADHGPGTWIAGYFLPPDFAYDTFDDRQLVRRWRRVADDRNLDRASLLAESLAALPDAAPPGADNSWQPYPGSPQRRLDLDAVNLEGGELVLDFSELEASAPGTTAGMAMGLQFEAIVTHYYPEVASVCVLVDGKASEWLHDTMTCPSRQ